MDLRPPSPDHQRSGYPKAALAPFRRQYSRGQDIFKRSALLFAIAMVGIFYGLSVSVLPMSFFLYLAMPIAAGVLLVIWALPEAKSYPAKGLERFFFASFIVSFIWPKYLAIALPGLPWITFKRAIGVPMIFVLLIALSISSDCRKRMLEPWKTSPLILKATLLFIAFQIITFPMTNHVSDSFNAFLDAQFEWTAILFLAAFVFSKPGRPLVWIWLFFAIALLHGLMSFEELKEGRKLWAGGVPNFLMVPDEFVQRILAGGGRAALGVHRTGSIFSTPLNFAEFVGLATPFILYLFAHSRNLLVKAAILAYLPLSFLVIRGTDSRLGVVAFFASILLYLLVWSVKLWRTNRRSLAAPALVLAYPAMAGVFVALTFVWNRLSVMVWGGGAQAASTEGRKAQYASALPKILSNPFGNGIGEGAMTLGDTNRAGVLTIDSYYLVLALEYGVLGFLAYATLIFAGIGQALRYGFRSGSREADLLLPAAVFLMVFVIVKGVLAQDDNHSLIFIVLGLVVALAHKVKLESQGSLPMPSGRVGVWPITRDPR